MEEKIRLEEETRVSLNRHGGDVVLVAQELGHDVDYVIKIREKMKIDLMKNPEVSLFIAGNISRALIEGRRHRTQNLRDMLESLNKREQLLVCEKCKSEVRYVEGQSDDTYFCPVCQKFVYRVLEERDEIYKRKQSIIRDLSAEDDKMTDHMVKMKWTNQLDTPVPPEKQLPNVTQNILIVGGESERKLVDDYSQMRPMDRALLAEKVRKDLLKLDEELTREKSEGTD